MEHWISRAHAALVLTSLVAVTACGGSTATEKTSETPGGASAAPAAATNAEQSGAEPSESAETATSGDDCKTIEPEVVKMSRMIEILRAARLEPDPPTLKKIADRLDIWTRTSEVKLKDPELTQIAKKFRATFGTTAGIVRKFEASVTAKETKKSFGVRMELEKELDKNGDLVADVVGRCGTDPYRPFREKGKLAPEVVKRVVQENFGTMLDCYKPALRKNPSLQGRIAVHFMVATDGSVVYAGDADNPSPDAPPLVALPMLGVQPPVSTMPPMPDAKVSQCVFGVFRKLRFPAPDRGYVTLIYPVEFSSSP